MSLEGKKYADNKGKQTRLKNMEMKIIVIKKKLKIL